MQGLKIWTSMDLASVGFQRVLSKSCFNKVFACVSRFTDCLREEEEDTTGMKTLLGRKRLLVGN